MRRTTSFGCQWMNEWMKKKAHTYRTKSSIKKNAMESNANQEISSVLMGHYKWIERKKMRHKNVRFTIEMCLRFYSMISTVFRLFHSFFWSLLLLVVGRCCEPQWIMCEKCKLVMPYFFSHSLVNMNRKSTAIDIYTYIETCI